jgi:hypothetical protein
VALVAETTRHALLERSRRRCECQSPMCRHHRGGFRCTRGLRGDDWEVVMREEGPGEKLWNLLAVCPECYPHLRDAGA